MTTHMLYELTDDSIVEVVDVLPLNSLQIGTKTWKFQSPR